MAFFSPPETLNLNESQPTFNPRAARLSSLSYTQSTPLRDTRFQPRKPATSWLVAIVPAPTLVQEPQIHAHTLATFPHGRFADGILVPLFPSLYAQLAAIAREFSMPSVVGLGLYLQTVHAGILTTPRISDETWPLLWSHLSDGDQSRNLSGPPIAGRIEFDIDHRKARWLETWLGAARRASVDLNPPFRAPWHLRDEIKVSDKTPFDLIVPETELDQEHSPEDYVSIPQRPSHPRGHLRHLSLLRGNGTNQPLPSTTKVLSTSLPTIKSPARHVEIMPDPKQELAERVQTWRTSSNALPPEQRQKPETASKEFSQVPTLSTHSTAVDQHASPARQEVEVTQELDLNDFQWSISSVGPGTAATSIELLSPSISIHLVNRLAGSVCITPTTATSFGPNDEAFDYDTFTASRLPSPDVAFRAIEDVPCTPTTATSWGVASWSGSVVEDTFETQSVDLGDRCAGSVPSTPIEESCFTDAWKQTPWGMIWPFNIQALEFAFESPMWSYNPSRGTIVGQPSTHWPYNAARGELSGRRHIPPSANQMDELVPEARLDLPYHAYIGYIGHAKFLTSREVDFLGIKDAWKLSPWGPIWPFGSQIPITTSFSWPYNAIRGAIPRDALQWAYNPARGRLDTSSKVYTTNGVVETTSFTMVIEPEPRSRYHAFQGYLKHSSFLKEQRSLLSNGSYVSEDAWKLDPWGHIWPHSIPRLSVEGNKPQTDAHEFCDRFLSTFASITPQPCCGEDHGVGLRNERSLTAAQPVESYPYCDSWKKSPWGLIWPYNMHQPDSIETSSVTMNLEMTSYPIFNLYPPVYPYIDVYPSCLTIDHPPTSLLSSKESEKNPAAWNDSIFSHLNFVSSDICFESGTLEVMYPMLVIYPAVYPNFNLYPSIIGSQYHDDFISEFRSENSEIEFSNPMLTLHPAIRLSLENYSSITGSPQYQDKVTPGENPATEFNYPILVIYPAYYPNFNLYPPIAGSSSKSMPKVEMDASDHTEAECGSLSMSTRSPVLIQKIVGPSELDHYPFLTVYTPIYPNIRLYPLAAGGSISLDELKEEVDPKPPRKFELQPGYPVISTYSAVYPHIEPYPTVLNQVLSPLQVRHSIFLSQGPYDSRGHRHVYPYIEPYHDLSRRGNRYSHATLHSKIFRNGYENTPSGSIVSILSRPLRKISYDTAGHQHVNPVIPHPFVISKTNDRKSHTDLHNAVFSEGFRPTPSGQEQNREKPMPLFKHLVNYKPEWNLPSFQREYPTVEPYPEVKLKSTSQERLKHLAITLNEETSAWDSYMAELLKHSPPVENPEFEPGQTSRRVSVQCSPITQSTSGLYSPINVPLISPAKC